MRRISMPETTGRRGAGLGNELNAWAKAFIAGRVLGARVLHPAWGLNPRGYSRQFGTSRLDYAAHGVLRAGLPTFRMTESDFAGAYDQDFAQSVERFAQRHALRERSRFLVLVGGMWGGMGILREAYPFLRSQLLQARNTVDNLAELETAVAPHELRIAVHVRRGDFRAARPVDAPPGPSFNSALPLEWYVRVCRSLAQQLSVPHRFLLFSDASPAELAPLVEVADPVTTAHQKLNICSDLLAMADADLLVTSCSSFSTWAAALSGSPFIWHASNLFSSDRSMRIWDHGAPLDKAAADAPRGVVVDDSGVVPSTLVATLEAGQRSRGWANDLVFYGAVPKS